MQGVNAILAFLQDKVDKYFDKFEVALHLNFRFAHSHAQLYCFSAIFNVPASTALPSDIVWRALMYCG